MRGWHLMISSPDARIGKLAAIGSIDDIVEQTEKMLKAGVDHVCYGHPLSEDPLRAVRQIGEKVIAHFEG